MRKRKYDLDDNYFETIDTEGKAYFLGLLYADGCVCFKKGINYANLGLNDPDRYILERMKFELKSTSPIFEIKKEGNHFYKSTTPKTKFHLIRFISKKMCQDLIKHGCVPKKSLILNFPTWEHVPKHLIHHFIRGYFDGDGCIHLMKRKNINSLHFSLLGTYSMLSNIKTIISEELGVRIDANIFPYKWGTRGYGIYSFHIKNKLVLEKIKHYLYKDSNFYLTRKKDIFYTNVVNKFGNTTSKYMNVCRKENKWIALFYDERNKRHGKLFDDEESAHNFLLKMGIADQPGSRYRQNRHRVLSDNCLNI